MSDQSTPVGEDTGTSEPVDNGSEGTTTEAPKAPDYDSRIDERFNELSGSMRQMFDEFQQQFQPQDDGYEEEDLLGPDDPGYDEQQQERYIQDLIDQRVQEQLTPLQEQQLEGQRNQKYESLRQKYTELQDEKVAAPIVEDAANWVYENIPNPERFIKTPAFTDLIERGYKAYVADKSAAQETPAGQRREVQLESGGGAAPADRDEDIQDRIIKAAQAASPRI